MASNVDTIKERLDIVEVISSYLKLDKAGQNYKARCPFHSEKTPSFIVSPTRQSFYCFGCGAKGDMFTFVEQTEGLDFMGAMRLLADKAGVALEYESRESKTELDGLYHLEEDASKFFQNELKANMEAQEYLKERGISDESVAKWQIGYAPDEWRALYSYLISVGISKELIIKAGLAKAPPESDGSVKKEPYDVFRGRITFPLRDLMGRTIAFSGRSLKPETVPKYLNSPDTALFRKSEVLYGLDLAKEEIRKKDYTVLVEGQIDMVLSHQAGVRNTVASSGTAFTREHLEKLKKFSPRIILAFDGDKAGEKAAYASTVLALTLGLEVKISSLPTGSDPASLIREDPSQWKETLRKSLPAIEHYLNSILREEDSRKRGKLIEKHILPLVMLLDSSMEKAHFVSLITRKTGIKEEVIWDDLKKVKSNTSPRVSAAISAEASIRKRSRTEDYNEILEFLKGDPEDRDLLAQKDELERLIKIEELDEKIRKLEMRLREGDDAVLGEINKLTRARDEEKRRMM